MRGVLTLPVMSPELSSNEPPEDLRVERFFERVLALRERQQRMAPDEFLPEVDALRAELKLLEQSHSEEVLRACFEAFARHRFQLVDSGDEYATAADEVLVLSMVSSEAPRLCIRALQEAVITLSSVLGEEGAVRQFGNLLRRLRQLARQTDDAELKAWVAGVVGALPEEPPEQSR
jgi:hypothetical protein